MKRRLLVVFTGLLFSGAAMASGGAFSKAPAPTQSYHSDAPASASATQAQQMAKVQAIMEKARHSRPSANNPQAQALPSSSTVKSNLAKTTAGPNFKNISNKELALELSTVNQNSILFQQRVNQEIGTLARKNKEMASKVANLDKAMLLLNQELAQKASRAAGTHSAFNNGTSEHQQLTGWTSVDHALTGGLKYAIYAILLALITLILMMMRRKPQLAPATTATQENSEEYDFMGTNEAIPAKLDLARAYIAMEDYAAANTVLEEVMQKGEASQRQEAQELLQQAKDKS